MDHGSWNLFGLKFLLLAGDVLNPDDSPQRTHGAVETNPNITPPPLVWWLSLHISKDTAGWG